MRFVVIDFETYFADDFTLSKMSTESYIRDSRFKAHGAAIKWSKDHAAHWYNEPELRYVLSQEDWSDVFLICHHTSFDGLILSAHYGVRPKMYGCTMSMARALFGTHLSVSLESVRKELGFSPKTTPYNLFRGKSWEALSVSDRQALAEGCEDEVESIWKIFGLLAKSFPAEEYEVVDSIIRMFVNPVLRADTNLLSDLWESEAKAKQQRMLDLGIVEADVQSAARFQALLEAEGVEIGYKENPKKELIPAFAKNDDFMLELLEHDNDRIRTLAEARIGAKSTLLQTRAETLGTMAQRGSLCVYLRYCGAATLRPTGGDGANWLNFKRGSAIRRSILAPKGYLLGPVDASQIEFRVAMELAGQQDVLDTMRAGGDPYVTLASAIYNEEIYKPKKDDPRRLEMEQKRGAGKQGRLMCLGPNTQVLTDQGIKPITGVKLTDRLWDGVEWVKHQGLISQGVERVVERKGVFMTPDHLVLCGNSWQPALRVKGSMLSQALATGSANLPSQATSWLQEEGLNLSSSNARAERLSIQWIRTICFQAKARVVLLVQKSNRALGIKNIIAMRTLVPIFSIDDGCSEGLESFTGVADTLSTQFIPITAGAEFKSTNLGKKTEKRFLRIWSRCRAGINPNWKSIELIIKADMCQAIFASQIAPLKRAIDAVSEIWSKRLPTYDIVCAGPRNRFTIVGSAGPLIVHNCIYGAAAEQYQKTAKAGLYGPPVDMDYGEAVRHVKIARDMMPAVTARNTGYWAQCERIIARLAGGPPMEWGPFLVKDHKLILPSGQAMIYDTLEFHRPDADEDCRDFERDGYWRMRVKRGWKKMWGSKLTQNICEMVSRVIVSQAMIRIKRQYGIRSLNWPYDELLLLIPDDSKAEETLELCRLEMCKAPSWLPGIPLDAEASLGARYSK